MLVRHSLLLTVMGPLVAASGERGLLSLVFLDEAYEYRAGVPDLLRRLGLADAEAVEDAAAFRDLARQLGEYFCGARRQFEVEVDLRGSAFQVAVWRRLLAIPYGQLRSYRQIARELRRPDAVRAVGQAVGRNPIGVIVPCHRVIGSDGDLVGFGPGLGLKAQLLRLEGHTLVGGQRIAAPRLF